MIVLSLAFWAQPAFAQERPVILPTRLDFDASHAPEICNDFKAFRVILEAWVPKTLLRDDAERRLVVRILGTSTRGIQTDVSVVNAAGVPESERHQDFPAHTECHHVLWKTALNAATILGAFAPPPPPKQPVPCPVCPTFSPCPLYPPPVPCPACPPLRLSPPTMSLSPAPYRSFLAIGAFVTSGISSELSFGPQVMLGFVPSRHLPGLHIEFEGAWTSPASSITSESIRLHSIPLVGSFCWVRGIVRFCGGVASTMFLLNQSSDNDPLRIMFGANFRVGTQLFTRSPFSIRADVFGRVGFAERRFGKATEAIDDVMPFAAGLAVMAGRSFD